MQTQEIIAQIMNEIKERVQEAARQKNESWEDVEKNIWKAIEDGVTAGVGKIHESKGEK